MHADYGEREKGAGENAPSVQHICGQSSLCPHTGRKQKVYSGSRKREIRLLFEGDKNTAVELMKTPFQ
jgi:hypothetical protein